mmetsp:Transcript_14363/g.33273  ORF Transcript_14363/g.33273 Transcript_14363/m.33273 type:complete len:246 (+) Transcript_14363:1490-2227(+)
MWNKTLVFLSTLLDLNGNLFVLFSTEKLPPRLIESLENRHESTLPIFGSDVIGQGFGHKERVQQQGHQRQCPERNKGHRVSKIVCYGLANITGHGGTETHCTRGDSHHQRKSTGPAAYIIRYKNVHGAKDPSPHRIEELSCNNHGCYGLGLHRCGNLFFRNHQYGQGQASYCQGGQCNQYQTFSSPLWRIVTAQLCKPGHEPLTDKNAHAGKKDPGFLVFECQTLHNQWQHRGICHVKAKDNHRK